VNCLQVVNPQAPRVAVRHLKRRMPEDALEIENVSTGPKVFNCERVAEGVE
jgi:hypothetical protein